MIAHRLETAVAHSDKILVLDHGELKEYDHAFRLLAKRIEDMEITNDGTIFSQMVRALNEN
jgi:ABC-type transport system involved in cytochrome bd biosynthesis fused ATPase/permease subunit